MKILKKFSSLNYNERAAGTFVDSVVLHYTAMSTADAALKWLCNPTSKVSCHYLIDEEGSLFLLVPEEKRAWHAGPSHWEGQDDMNSRSIGIELANLGNGAFPKRQIDSLSSLLKEIVKRYKINPSRVLAHSDVAPQRKIDPGPWFPWHYLASQNLALWVSRQHLKKEISNVMDFQRDLRAFGYECLPTGIWDLQSQNVRRAFLMRFYPELWRKQSSSWREHSLLKRLLCKKIEIHENNR